MARTSLRGSLATCLLGGLVVWSCASDPGHETNGGAGGASAGRGGVGGGGAGSGGSASGAGGVSNQAGGGAGGIAGAVSGNGGAAGNATAGTSSLGLGGEPEGGVAAVGAAGAPEGGSGEGGAGGAGDSIFEGHCGEGWAAPGASPPDLAGTVTPVSDKSGNWTFAFGRYRLVVAGKRGARVVELSIDGNNLIDPTQGSTFWPSPQQAYTWPPPAELDSDPYAAEADATSVTLSSDVATSIGLSVSKRFSVNAASGVISIDYQLTNEANKTASWAPWEVTRVPAGGYTFAPKGPGNRTITQDSFQNPLPLSLLPPAPAAGGIEWLNYPSLKLTLDNYIAEFDGAEGWLAHADRFGASKLPVLFVKSFVDAADATLPTNQAEIQLWTSATAKPKLIEVEEQGAQQSLAAGASLSWTVHWSV